MFNPAIAARLQAPHKVNLGSPQKTIIVNLLKNACAVAVAEQFRELAKFNLRTLTTPPEEEGGSGGKEGGEVAAAGEAAGGEAGGQQQQEEEKAEEGEQQQPQQQQGQQEGEGAE